MQPNFVCVGAAKAGTTWLHLCLREHPEVFVPAQKEIRFFSNPELLERGVDWYESLFDDGATALAVGDISGSYMADPAVPARIHGYRPEMRLIFVLRNPIERAFSHYRMDLRTGDANGTPERVLTFDSEYVQRGLYHAHLTRFLSYFPAKQVHLVFHDDIASDPPETLRQVYRFLGVDSAFVPEVADRSVNTARQLPRFPRLYRSLRGAYGIAIKRSRFLEATLEDRRLKGSFDVLHRINAGGTLPPLSPSQAHQLSTFFEADVKALSSLVSRDLDHWLQPDPELPV